MNVPRETFYRSLTWNTPDRKSLTPEFDFYINELIEIGRKFDDMGPGNPIQLSPQARKAIEESFADDLSRFSIGKLKAICQKNGIKAAKMKRPQLEREVRRIFKKQNEPVEYYRDVIKGRGGLNG